MKLFNTIVLFILLITFSFCTKPKELPTVTTIGVKDIGINSASAFGSITGSDITAKGICWDTLVNPNIEKKFSNEGEGSKSFSTALTNLLPNKKYYVRAYATNEQGTAYGDSKGFNTIATPTVITYAVTSYSCYYAFINGAVSGTLFTPLMAGICYDTKINPDTTKNVKASSNSYNYFSLYATNLSEKTVYYYRAFAIYSFGIVYGNTLSFTTTAAPIPPTVFTNTGTMSDLDGNSYQTVTINGVTWMTENLKTAYYSDGSSIPYLTSGAVWNSTSQGAYGSYSNSSSNFSTYGALYNYYAIADPRGLAPPGWHIPTTAEWQTLFNTLSAANSTLSVFSQMVNGSYAYWSHFSCNIPNNYSNMKVIPGGYRSGSSGHYEVGNGAYFWTATNTGGYADYYSFDQYCNTNKYGNPFNFGLSVRCVKD